MVETQEYYFALISSAEQNKFSYYGPDALSQYSAVINIDTS